MLWRFERSLGGFDEIMTFDESLKVTEKKKSIYRYLFLEIYL